MPLERKWKYPQPKTYYDVKYHSAGKRICINQGGTRSGKTYSTLQVLCEFAKANEGKGLYISVVRKTSPSLKASAYRDFIEILQKQNWYSEEYHNKTAMEYYLFGNTFEFFAVDEPQKMRGRKRHICFVNEANEITYEDFFQLNIRTTYKMILDFNPSDEYLWIYDLPDQRRDKGDTVLFVSNYTHNPHLPEDLLEEIEQLEKADSEYWKVYGMGLRGASREIIFNHWREIDDMPGFGVRVYGQDFGFNVASATVAIEIHDGAVYADEILYKPKLITSDIVRELTQLGVGYDEPIFCDAAAADRIAEMQRAGMNALKGQKDVLEGINKLKSMPLYITKRSANLLKEIRNYKWKRDEKLNRVLDEPVKFNDHAVDALRYAVYSYEARALTMSSYSSPE